MGRSRRPDTKKSDRAHSCSCSSSGMLPAFLLPTPVPRWASSVPLPSGATTKGVATTRLSRTVLSKRLAPLPQMMTKVDHRLAEEERLFEKRLFGGQKRIVRWAPALLISSVLCACMVFTGTSVFTMICMLAALAAPALIRPLPSAQDIIVLAPPTSYTPERFVSLRSGGSLNTTRVCAAIMQEMHAMIQSGVQHMEEGKKSWHRVCPETLFMSFSVVKGVAATALLTCVDVGECTYDQRVSDIWEGFGARGKRDITVADAVSHRAGLPRISRGLVLSHIRGTPQEAWAAGKRHIEEYKPDWVPGEEAKYHYLSFSWIIGGIIEAACRGAMSFREVVRERVAKRLGAEGYMFVGGLDTEHAARTARLLPPPLYPPVPKRFEHLSPLERLKRRVLAALECRAFVTVGNSRWWRRLCLPSSNGYFTARAVARMYGAVVNGGSLRDGSMLVSAESANNMLHRVASGTEVRTEGKDTAARTSLGYSPWVSTALHGDEPGVVTVGHNGMGGGAAFGQVPSGLAICVMKNTYEPSVWVGGSVSPGVARMVAAVRAVCSEQAVPK